MVTWIVLIAVVIFIILVVLYNGGWMQKVPAWTGFRDNEKVVVADETQKDQTTKQIISHEPQPGKTLWDWLQLLIVPAVLAVVGFSFNAGQESINLQLEQQRNQEQVVDAYLDRMSNLLLAYNLHDSQPGSSVRATAQAITLTTLERLDADHKRIAILFLYRADLIMYHFNYQKNEPKRPDKDKPIIALPLADLEEAKLGGIYLGSVDLHNMYLSGADFHGSWLEQADLGVSKADHADFHHTFMRAANLYYTDLTDANLQNAILREANMPGAFLSRAQLNHADLWKANLGMYHPTKEFYKTQLDNATLAYANLRDACLTGANLTNADLTGADLRGAMISLEQLAKAKSLVGTTMPDGTKHS